MHPWVTASVTAVGALALAGVLAWSALQPPLHIQAFRQGVWHYRRGEFAAAAEHFTRAKTAGHPAASIARGRTHLRMGENDAKFLPVAISDFYETPDFNRDPGSMAQVAQCRIRLGQLPQAATLYRQAIDQGAKSAPLLNNLGSVCLQTNQRDEALRWLDEAIAADARLQVAYANRALLKLQQALASSRPPLDAIEDIEQALAVGPPHAQLLREAGFMHAVAARFDSSHTLLALDYLERAVDLGASAASILKDVGFRAIAQEPRFKLLADRPAPPLASKYIRVVDLFDDEAFFAAQDR